MNEVWKPVSGYEASYEVRNTGKVRSIDRSITTGRIKGKELTQTLKPCYGKCDRCVWKNNGGCSEWRADQ